MESAELERTTVDIAAKAGGRTLDLRATGTVVKFDGFLTLYTEDQDDKADDEDANRLPQMAAGEALHKREIDATQHFTEPPPRYSEASLVKRMEELGIGRPSTYASILQVLQRPRLRAARQEAARARGQGPRADRVPGELLRALRRIRLHRRPRRAARPDLQQRGRLEGGAARLLARLHRRGRRHQGTAHRAGDRRARRDAGAAPVPAEQGRQRSAQVPELRERPASA